MTLKLRLTFMMIVLLGAVMALQYLLLQREQRLLGERLSRFGRDIEESTRVLSGEDPWQGALCDSLEIETILETLGAAGDGLRVGSDHPGTSVIVRVFPDSARIELLEAGGELEEIAGDGPAAFAWRERAQALRERLGVDHTVRVVHEERIFQNERGDTVRIRPVGGPAPAGADATAENLVKVHLAMPRGADGARRSLQLLYPVADLTAELERARKRSGLWLLALLGVGAAGAVLVAVQFTRPIKALEGSFGRVVAGDLDVRVSPERSDEIGRLTTSFNDMVGRLRETREMEGRLSEAERLATVGRLAAGVAHEVRNPLNTMLLTMQQLGRKSGPDADDPERERFDRYVSSVTGELQRLERLVGAFLELARTGDLAIEGVDVRATVREAIALFEAEAKESGVAIESELPADLAVPADPSRLPTVWNNLLSNALRASPRGATVRVRARAIDGGVEVTVADAGAGIAANDVPHIWEPFWSGRPDGTGLGLSLVRSVVERHGGRVDVASASGEGTTMTVFLPGGERA